MKKPELKDFGLNEELLDLNKKQREKYYARLNEQHTNNCTNAKKIKITIIAVSILITFFVLIMNIIKGFEDGISFIILCGCCTWCVIVVSNCFLSLNEPLWHFGNSKEIEIKAQTIDADLDIAVEKYNKAVRDYENYFKKCSIDFWNSLDGFGFEREIAKLFRSTGYDATVTPATGDGGVDIVLIKDGEKIAVQCKHHAKPVGPNDIRALQGVVASRNYSKGIFISLNGYTSIVRQEVRRGTIKIDLWDLKDILKIAKGEEAPCAKDPLCDSVLKRELTLKAYQSLDDASIDFLLGKTVMHKTYGEGIITFITDRKYIEVYFLKSEEEKKFVFPDAFADKHLVPVNFRVVNIKQGE